jgi:hypothetical protein
MRALVGLAYERCAALAHPPSGEPTPVSDGATVAEWAYLAGLAGDPPHKAIEDVWPHPLHCEPHHHETVTHRALQRLTNRARVESVKGRPLRYRPVNRAS